MKHRVAEKITLDGYAATYIAVRELKEATIMEKYIEANKVYECRIPNIFLVGEEMTMLTVL